MKKICFLPIILAALLLPACKKEKPGVPLPTDDEWVLVGLNEQQVGLPDGFVVSYVVAESGYVGVELTDFVIYEEYWEYWTGLWYGSIPADRDGNGEPAALEDLISASEDGFLVFAAYYEREGDLYYFEASYKRGDEIGGEPGLLILFAKAV